MDVVEVSGFYNEAHQLRATRLEKKSVFENGLTEVELKGRVANLVETRFELDSVVVDFSAADLSDVSGGVVQEGMFVEVEGRLEDGIVIANYVEEEDNIDDLLDDDDEVSVEGTIANFVNDAQFEINGIAVNAENAALFPGDLVLANGLIVEAEGRWQDGVLIARKLESRRGRVEIEASVASVDSVERTITMQLFSGTVTVQVTSSTLMDDDLGSSDFLTIEDISAGDFLEVEAIQGDQLQATRIDRDEKDDDVLQAPVDSFNPGSDITLLGITYPTGGAEFEDRNGNPISSSDFYATLQVGDLVKVEDELVADGIADEVEFEAGDRLDGADEFERDEDESEADEADETEDGDESEDSAESEDDEKSDESDEQKSGEADEI